MAVKNTTQVLIDGKIITLGGYESPEYLQKVAAYLNQKISELSQSAGYNRLSVDTKHTLLALNIADDYFKAKSQVDTLEEDMEAKDRETYDMKHDLIAAEIQAGDLKKELEEKRIELEHVRGEMEELQRQLDKAVLDVFIGRHDHENEAPGVREDDLEMADSHFPGRSRHGIGREVRQLGDELADLAHGLVQLLHTRFHGLIDALRLVDGEAVILHQTVDVEAVARGARDAPGRRVRLLQKAERRQLGHFVADSRRGEIHVRQRGDRLGADRLCAADVEVDNGLQDLLFALRKLHGFDLLVFL